MPDEAGKEIYAFTADFYDRIVPYQSRPDVGFYVDAAKDSKGPVLEIGCGTGRILIPTARAGISIVGVDLSEHMLEKCRAKLKAEPAEVQSRVRLVTADMRRFELGTAFPLVTIPFRPFQHLTTVEDQIACLGTVRRHLRDGGRVIFDLFNPAFGVIAADNAGQELGPDSEFTMLDGRKVARYWKFVSKDFFNQINYMEFIYHVTHPDGRKEKLVHPFPMRYLFRYEVEHLLERCGFHLEHVYADFDRSGFGSKYPGELILMAQKS
jgi:SAM-dependent methyltransferase